MSKKVDKIYKYYVVVTSKDVSRQKFPISTQSAFGQKLEEYLKQHPEHPVKVTAGSPSADQMNKVTGLISFLGIALTIMVIYFYFISSRSSTTAQGGVGRGMGGMLDSITKNKTK